jgi:hypothetical protein
MAQRRAQFRHAIYALQSPPEADHVPFCSAPPNLREGRATSDLRRQPMLDISTISTVSRRIPLGVRLAAIGIAAGLGYGLIAASPASAAMADWQMACRDKAAPQGYGESMRYSNCIRQRDCQAMADRTGRRMMAMGCFGVAPEAQPRFRH